MIGYLPYYLLGAFGKACGIDYDNPFETIEEAIRWLKEDEHTINATAPSDGWIGIDKVYVGDDGWTTVMKEVIKPTLRVWINNDDEIIFKKEE